MIFCVYLLLRTNVVETSVAKRRPLIKQILN